MDNKEDDGLQLGQHTTAKRLDDNNKDDKDNRGCFFPFGEAHG